MKKIIVTFIILFSSMAYSQVIIGDETGTATDNTSVLIDFADTNDRGIILPYNRTLATSPTEGTITVDASDATKAKVVYYNGAWVDLSSGNEADISAQLSNQPLSTGPNAVVEDANAKAIIGSSTTTANGVLVLESTDKAMVLPQVTSTDDVIDPAPGMMVFINITGAERLAVFNGAKWTFWSVAN